MAQIKVRRIEKNLQYALSDIAWKISPMLEKNVFISINKVITSADLNLAKVYVSFLNHQQNKSLLLKKIESKKPYIKKILGDTLGKHMRKIPDLRFVIDDTYDYIKREEEIFSGLS